MPAAPVGNIWRSPRLWWRLATIVIAVGGFITGSYSAVFFTTLSSAMAVAYLVVTVYLMLHTGLVGQPAPRLRGAITSYVVTTALVSHFINEHGANPLPGLVVADQYQVVENWTIFLLHYVVPIMFLIDWLVFGPHVVRWRDGLLWLLFPAGYAVVMIVRGILFPAIDDRYPYGFLDPTIGGWGVMFLAMLQVLVFILVISVAVIGLGKLSDRLSPERHRTAGGS